MASENSEGLICPACEEGTCEIHSSGGGNTSDPNPVVRDPDRPRSDDGSGESKLRSQVARAVRRLNRAIKATRKQRASEPIDDPVTPPGEPAPIDPGPRKRSDVAGFASGIVRNLQRKKS